MRRRALILCLLVAFVGCGDNGGETRSQITFVAGVQLPLRWTKRTYRTEAGRVELRVVNPSQAPHRVGVERSQKCCKQPGTKQFGTSKTVSTGETTDTIVELSPGRYWAYCRVDGHWQAGMVSRLIVK